jgi:hypothetical protein
MRRACRAWFWGLHRAGEHQTLIATERRGLARAVVTLILVTMQQWKEDA